MAARDVFGIVGTTQAGNFHVERVVAEGGFGVVYRAQHGAFRAPVAIKCLKIPEQMTKQQRAVFLEKFREEAELMFRLSAAITEVLRPLHVDVLHLGDGRFVPFLALEWLEGESLDGIITRRREQGQAPLGLHKVVKMLRPVASALSRAHRFPGPQGAIAIIHRDLKPENIFLANIGGTESMKILDFGIAKAKRAASQAVGRVTGRTLMEDESASFTPAYGAPEQWSPKTYGETGPWTDVFGLALCLVEALCGTPPIDGDTYVMRRACLDDKRRPTPRALGADVPIEVEKVFEKALAVDPRKRFKDIESFWSELETAMGLEPSLRTRDARREPGEPAAPQKMPPGLTSTGSRLGRVDLLKMPAIVEMPAMRPEASEPAPEPKRAAPIPRNEPAPSAKPKPAPAADEDWSSLGLGDAPASSSRQPDAPRKPPSRRHSVGLELPLQMRADAPDPRAASRVSSPDLEMSLPTQASANIEPATPSSERAAAPGPMRRPSVELEMSLPIHQDGPPPPASSPEPQRAPDPTRRSLLDLELALPTMDAAPEPPPSRPSGPQRKPTGELELSLPTMGAAEDGPPPARTSAPGGETRPPAADGALDFELHVPTSKPTAAAAPQLDAGPARRPDPARPIARRSERPPPQTLAQRLKTPVALLLLGLVVGLIDVYIVRTSGNPAEVGSVRLTWIAAPFALVGLGLLLWRLIGVHEGDHEDD